VLRFEANKLTSIELPATFSAHNFYNNILINSHFYLKKKIVLKNLFNSELKTRSFFLMNFELALLRPICSNVEMREAKLRFKIYKFSVQ